MNKQLTIDDIAAMSVAERLDLIERIWASLEAETDNVPVPDWHLELLQERLDEDEKDASPGESWEEVRRHIEGQG